MTDLSAPPMAPAPAKVSPARIGFVGNLILHSQFILIGLLVLGAVLLKVSAR